MRLGLGLFSDLLRTYSLLKAENCFLTLRPGLYFFFFLLNTLNSPQLALLSLKKENLP